MVFGVASNLTTLMFLCPSFYFSMTLLSILLAPNISGLSSLAQTIHVESYKEGSIGTPHV